MTFSYFLIESAKNPNKTIWTPTIINNIVKTWDGMWPTFPEVIKKYNNLKPIINPNKINIKPIEPKNFNGSKSL